ncbi:hypothetical protein SCUP234_12752 [Seiridium cupressi]
MSDRAGQYQGSQAFSHIQPSETESVNPNTGSLNYRTPLINLQGVRPSVDLKVNLLYGAGTTGTFGLPTNWSFDLPYVFEGKSVTANGRTYAVDLDWVDTSDHQSGLRYLNNHGIKFQKIDPPQELPSGQPGYYGYQLDHVDGSSDYFDVHGKPLMHRDLFNNYILYAYLVGPEAGVDHEGARLDYIIDSWGQKIHFGYQDASEVQIILPSNDAVRIQFSDLGILTVELPEGLRTELNYEPFVGDEGMLLLGSITHPTGLTSLYEYQAIQYLAHGESYDMPAVRNHYQKDQNGIFYRHEEYDFGGFSTHTYTGAAIGLNMAGATDTLMDSDGKALTYTYDVTRTSFDEEDKKTSRTTTWFNNYHLPIKDIRYTLDSQNEFVEAYMTVNEYEIDLDERARATNYTHPKSTEVFHNITSSGSSPNYQPLTISKAEYNKFGNQVSSSEDLQVPGLGYVRQITVSNEYATSQIGPAQTARNIQFVVKSSRKDEVVGTEDYTENTPTEDGKGVAITTNYFRSGGSLASAQLKPWTQSSYSYDTQGRVISETLSWAPGAQVPKQSVQSVTTRTSFSFENGLLTRTDFDAANNATIFQHDTETFEFDALGRPIKHTNAMGQLITTDYTIGPNGSSQRITSPLGYVKLTISDVLGREVEVFDNGDPTAHGHTSEPSRLLSRTSYDFLSRLQQSTNKLGLITTYSYDALNRPLSIIDPKGNIATHEYDDASLRVTEFLNNDVRTITQLNGRSDAIQTVKLPDSGNNSATYCIVENTTYDGNRRAISKALRQRPKDESSDVEGPLVLERTDIEHGPRSLVLARTVFGNPGGRGQDLVKRSFTYDLFGNVYTWVKKTSYSDGRSFLHEGPVELYDHNNRMAATLNQLGQEGRSIYDANGWLQKMIRFDGSEVSYSCNALGQTIKTRYPSSSTENTYDAHGQQSQVNQGDDIVTWHRTLDGTLERVQYADGCSQTYTLDKFSRVIKESDVFGVIREIEFNETGDVARRSCKGDTVIYDYGRANHSNGQYIGYQMNGQQMNYTTAVTYDGHNRPKQTIVRDTGSKILLDTTYEMNGLGKLEYLKSASAVSPELNQERRLVYDGLGQVIRDARASLTAADSSIVDYTYDGNSNVISKAIDGQAPISMTYNKIDQRADPGFEYDANGRMIGDDQGHKYSFDDQDHMVSVQVAAGAVRTFDYRADEFLADVTGPADSTKLYYSGGKINAVQTSSGTENERTSLFSGPRSLISGHTEDRTSEYFVDSLGSTALVLGDGDQYASSRYDAYGKSKTSFSGAGTLKPSIGSKLGFGQEFSDEMSGLVYLRCRYYSPHHMAFISMDRYHQENRYSYCEGDPINNIDPLGLSWKSWLIALGVGIVVGALFTFGVGALVGAAAAGLGATAATASTLSAVIGGAAGNVAGSYARSLVTGERYGGREILIDASLGALGGAASAYAAKPALGLANKFVDKVGWSQLRRDAIVEGLKNAANTTTQAALRPVFSQGRMATPLELIQASAVGFVGSYASSYVKGWGKVQYEAYSPRIAASYNQHTGGRLPDPSGGGIELM